MLRKTLFVLLLLNFIQQISFSQNAAIDSLQIALKTARADTNKVNILNGLSFEFRSNNPDTSYYFAENALKLSNQLGYKLGIANSNLNLGSVAINFGETQDALKKINESVRIYDELLESNSSFDKNRILKQKSRAYSIIGNAEFSLGNFSNALTSYFEALKIREEIDDKTGIGSAYNNIGAVYLEEGNYPEALKTHLAALKIREELGDKVGIAGSFNNIGNVYDAMNNYPEALKNHTAALKIRKEINDLPGIANSYNNIGGINTILLNFPDALKNHLDALKIREEIGDKSGIAVSYSNIAGVYMSEGNYAEALKNNLSALTIAEEIGDKLNMANVYIALGNISTITKKYEAAKIYLQKALLLSNAVGSLDYLKTVHLEMAVLDSTLGNFDSAFKNYKLFISYRDSLFNAESSRKLVQAQMQYEFDKKESLAKAVQDKKDAISKAEINRQMTIRNTFFAGFALLLIFSIVVYHQRNKISKEKKRSDQLVLDKEMLLKEIHHRVKNNLEVISSLLELQAESIKDVKAKAAVMEGQSRVQSIALIHHKLYRTEDVSSVEFKNFVSDLYKQVESVFKKPETEVAFNIKAAETIINIDSAVPLGLIINELLTNTFKYAMNEDHLHSISIELIKGHNDDLKMIYRDSGPGMPTGFDLQKSVSLGMKVIQLLTRQLGGDLKYYNDQGSVFEIPLKNGSSSYL